jgi:hypothetical protein
MSARAAISEYDPLGCTPPPRAAPIMAPAPRAWDEGEEEEEEEEEDAGTPPPTCKKGNGAGAP